MTGKRAVAAQEAPAVDARRASTGQAPGQGPAAAPGPALGESPLSSRRLERRLRALNEPTDVLAAAAAEIGVQLRVSRVTYAEIDESGVYATVERDWTDGSVPSVVGRHRVDDFGSAMIDALRQGRPVVCDDVEHAPSTSGASVVDAFRRLEIAAFIGIPLVREERLRAVLAIHSTCARRWAHAEIEFAQDAAERTWETVERARAEAALRESEERWKLALDASESGAWELNLLNHRAWRSLRHDQIFGYEQLLPEWTYERFLQHVVPEDRERVDLEFRHALEERRPWRFECRILRRDGVLRWIRARGRARYDATATPTRMWGVVEDVTDQKAFEQELRESARHKDEFLATLAHELRNPLSPIRAAARVLDHEGGSPAEQAQARRIIARQVSHMARLLDDLMDVSRISRGVMELRRSRSTLQTLIEAAVETAQPLIEARRHRLELDLPACPIELEVDPIRITQVVANLLTNAAKYTDAGGEIRVAAHVGGDGLVIRVKDNGVGLAPNAKRQLFQMFFQYDGAHRRSEGGLGVGLALVRGLVELHDGRVEALSEGPGRGSEFVVRLPASCVVEAEPAAHPAPATESARPLSRRILVADDNRDAADSLAMLLELRGHEVQRAHSGDEALALAERERPDVLVLDIGMPGLDGYAVARRVREHGWGRHAMLIAATGWGQDEDRRRARAAGFDHHLTKPVDPDEIERLLAPR